ncbi:hypothetical protein Peur_001449 [Populus x canadensis]
MENNSLAHAFIWICVGIANGLAFLHEDSTLKIVHGDIKTTNLLLNEDLNSKISDFSLAKLDEEENTHISTRIAGTICIQFWCCCTGTVAGKSNIKYQPDENLVCLLDWAFNLPQKGNQVELVDERLGSKFNKLLE